jgi:hypothetical protein
MTSDEWAKVYTTDGKLAAEMVKLTLESFGIEVLLAQESLGSTYGLTVGPLGETNVMVPVSKADEAKEILAAMDAGSLEDHSVNDDEGNNKDSQTEITKDF